MKRIVVSGAVLALAIGGVQAATAAPSVVKVTGGGQITEVSPEGVVAPGAGNTIAFNAQAEDAAGDVAKGQVQYIDRTAGNGRDQQRYHGYVTCVFREGNMARIQGQMRGEAETTTVDFTIDVVDNGQGGTAEGFDMIAFRLGAPADVDDQDSDATGDVSEDFKADGSLGRGNVKIHEAPAGGGAPAGGEATTKGKKNG